MKLNTNGPYGRLHIGPTYEMSGAPAVAMSAPSVAQQAKTTVDAHTPRDGVWVLLRDGAPWLRVFPFGWVPVLDFFAQPVAGQPGWRVDPDRITARQVCELAHLLEGRGLAPAAETLVAIGQGGTVAIGPRFVQSVHDFTHHVAAVVLGPGGAA